MHGLINRSIQCFVTDTYGTEAWQKTVAAADIGTDNFEAMLSYDTATTDAVLNAASDVLAKPRQDLLEDLGTYLVANPNVDRLRRLLRFGGVGFAEFLHSLDELHDRARLAVPDLEMPNLELCDHSPATFSLQVDCRTMLPDDGKHSVTGFGHVVMGILRAMADEYGALVLLEHRGAKDGIESIGIDLLAAQFSEGRSFSLTAG